MREPSKINNHMLEVNINAIKCKEIGKAPSYPSLGPPLFKDLLGMGPALDMLMRSLDPGRLSTFVQFDTFRISRSYFSTFWKAPIKGVLEGSLLGKDHRRKTVITKCSTQTICFERFVRGVELRVGSKLRPDQEIIMEVMKLLMNNMEVP